MTTKQYRVIGRREFLEFAPGETFWATLGPEWEKRAIDRGDIEPVEEKRPKRRQPKVAVTVSEPEQEDQGDPGDNHNENEEE